MAVVASHCDRACWLYPSSPTQRLHRIGHGKRQPEAEQDSPNRQLSESTKRLKINASMSETVNGITQTPLTSNSNKYRPFRLVEEEVISSLTALLTSTDPSTVSTDSSTMIAGALTMALSYINRETIAYTESLSGPSNAAFSDQHPLSTSNPNNPTSQALDSRILLLSVSPSPDLAHQYIPIMNAIFACQRLSIPIDVLHIPLPATRFPSPISTSSISQATSSSPFFQQASDATHGIYIPIPATDPKPSLITYLLTALLPSPATRQHLVLPTSISVDFRAACFCHRRIVSIGFVCSICLSIFCEVPEGGDCLTCGTHLSVREYGGNPVVVNKKKKKRKDRIGT